MSGWASRIIPNPSRTSAWSSAIRTRITAPRPRLQRQPRRQREAALGRRARAGPQLAAVDRHALAHAHQAVAAAVWRSRRAPRPSSRHLEHDLVARRSAPPPRARAGPACLSALVSPSWTIRYAERSMPGGSGRGSPSTRTFTGRPASRTCSTSASRPARPGWGASDGRRRRHSRSDAEHAAQLGEGRAPGVLDRRQRPAGALGVDRPASPRPPRPGPPSRSGCGRPRRASRVRCASAPRPRRRGPRSRARAPGGSARSLELRGAARWFVVDDSRSATRGRPPAPR